MGQKATQEQQAVMRRLSFEGQIYGTFIDSTPGRDTWPRGQSIIKELGDWNCIVQAVGPEIRFIAEVSLSVRIFESKDSFRFDDLKNVRIEFKNELQL